MIGMIGVDERHRQQGIASALIRQCEMIAVQQWNEIELYAHIEETNHMAIQCLTKLGYTNVIDATSPHVDYC